MTKISATAAALLAAGAFAATAMAQAQTAPARPADAASWASSHPVKGPSLAASANRALENADVPSARDDQSLAARADADIARRDHEPRLTASRQNLKGDAAKQAIARQQTPATYDRDIQMGDKDHTEQFTSLKFSMQKQP